MQMVLPIVVSMHPAVHLPELTPTTPVPVLTGLAPPVRDHAVLGTGEAGGPGLWRLVYHHQSPLVGASSLGGGLGGALALG